MLLTTIPSTIPTNQYIMATQRRTKIPEKTVLSHAEIKAEPKSNIAPAVPSFVHLKAMQYE
jgi:hypothetical protein